MRNEFKNYFLIYFSLTHFKNLDSIYSALLEIGSESIYKQIAMLKTSIQLKKWHERIPMTNRFHFPKLSSKK
jgi:hypothetical protein